VLKDMALPPGRHFVSLTGTEGDYALAATTTAPAVTAPTEREPNDGPEQSGLLAPGKMLTGTLPTMNDLDMFRISMRSRQRVAIHVEPRTPCPLSFELSWNTATGRTPSATIGD